MSGNSPSSLLYLLTFHSTSGVGHLCLGVSNKMLVCVCPFFFFFSFFVLRLMNNQARGGCATF